MQTLLNVHFRYWNCPISITNECDFELVQVMEMSVFPRISLKPEVTNFLQSVFLNKEVRISVFFLFLNDHKPHF